MNIKEFLALNYTEQLKNFCKLEESDLRKYINTKGFSINKKLHPIIVYNYPHLMDDIIKNGEVENSITAIKYVIDNEIDYDLSDEQIDLFHISQKIHNKEIDVDLVCDFLKENNVSNRRINQFAKVYPVLYGQELHDDFKYNKLLMAVEIGNVDYIIKNIDYVISIFDDEKVSKIKSYMPEVYKYLPTDYYTDTDLLPLLDKNPELVEFIKDETLIFKMWLDDNSTVKYSCIDTWTKLAFAEMSNLEVSRISHDLMETYPEYIITHYPYFYEEYKIHFPELCDDNLEFLALKDPYNFMFVDMNYYDNIIEFIRNSNNNLYDAYIVAEEFKECLQDDIDRLIKEEFADIYTAITTYPILSLFVDKKHLTPYVYNLMVNIDNRMFEFI